MKWVEGLRIWRKDRNITAVQGSFVEMIHEELQEYYEASTEHGRIDAIADILVLATNECELEGYNIDLVMKQVVKHISSRKQDPSQAAIWKSEGVSGKWMKDKNQHPSTIYNPDYTVCKL